VTPLYFDQINATASRSDTPPVSLMLAETRAIGSGEPFKKQFCISVGPIVEFAPGDEQEKAATVPRN
jgi:hypothetical protein